MSSLGVLTGNQCVPPIGQTLLQIPRPPPKLPRKIGRTSCAGGVRVRDLIGQKGFEEASLAPERKLQRFVQQNLGQGGRPSACSGIPVGQLARKLGYRQARCLVQAIVTPSFGNTRGGRQAR